MKIVANSDFSARVHICYLNSEHLKLSLSLIMFFEMVFIHKLLKMEYKDVNPKWEIALLRTLGHFHLISKVMSNCNISMSGRANDSWIGGKLVKYKMKQLLRG